MPTFTKAGKMQPLKIEWLKIVRPKRGRVYYYFKTGQKGPNGREILVALPDKDDPTFWSVYGSLKAGRSRRKNIATRLTLPAFVKLFQRSDQFRALSANTQDVYNLYLDQLAKHFNTAPADEVTPQDMQLLVDEMAGKPGAANMILAATASLYVWGRRRRHVSVKPCEDVIAPEGGEYQPWPDALLSAALEAEKPLVNLAAHLLYYTGQRIGDVCKLRWTDIRDGRVELTQEKTGKMLSFPVHPQLAALLAATPRAGLTILARDGRPYDRQQVRWHLKRFAAGLGYEAVPHGLRKNAVNSLLEAGCSVAEVSAITGQSLQIIEHYAKARNNRKLGDGAVLKWGRKR